MKKNNSMYITTFICFFVLVLTLASPFDAFAKDDAQLSVAEKLDNKRKSFYVKKKELLKKHRTEIVQFKNQIKKLKLPEKELNKELNKESDNTFSLKITNEFAKGFAKVTRIILFPMMTLNIAMGGGGLLYFFYLVTIANCVRFLYRHEQKFFIKKKKLIYITATALFLLFVSPSLVHANEGNNELFDKITETEKIIKLSPLDREIRILESYNNKYGLPVKITKIKTENPYLQPLEDVQTGEWTYYYTLAALYIEADQHGNAVDKLNVMFTKFGRSSTKLQIDSALKSISYLLQKDQIDFASKALDRILPTINDTQSLLNLTDQLYQYHMDDSAKQSLDRAIKIARDEAALIQLSNYFINKGKNDEASDAINAAIRKTRSKDKLFDLIKFAAQNKMENSLNQGIEKLPEMTKSLEDYFQVSDYLLEQQRVEQSSRTISMGLDSIPSKFRNNAYTDNYLKAAKLATERGNYAQAIRAIEKLGPLLGSNAINFKVPLSFVSIKKETLPTNEAILLPSFYGSLQQESGFSDKAKPSYIQAVTQVLDQAQETFQLETGLNDFFYLWEFYKEKNDYQTLEKLDFLYSFLEDQYLQRLKQDHQQRIKSLSTVIDTLKSNKINVPLKPVNPVNPVNNFELILSIIFHGLSALSTICLLLFMLDYCYKYAVQYCKNSIELKVFGFITKFIENIGWAYCFTLIGLFYGIIIIFISQFFQIGHQQLGVTLRKEKSEMEKS